MNPILRQLRRFMVARWGRTAAHRYLVALDSITDGRINVETIRVAELVCPSLKRHRRRAKLAVKWLQRN